MKPLTKSEHRAMVDVQRALVYVGWHPAIAGKLVRRTAARVMQAKASGFG